MTRGGFVAFFLFFFFFFCFSFSLERIRAPIVDLGGSRFLEKYWFEFLRSSDGIESSAKPSVESYGVRLRLLYRDFEPMENLIIN